MCGWERGRGSSECNLCRSGDGQLNECVWLREMEVICDVECDL